jgi:hypothetical protein
VEIILTIVVIVLAVGVILSKISDRRMAAMKRKREAKRAYYDSPVGQAERAGAIGRAFAAKKQVRDLAGEALPYLRRHRPKTREELRAYCGAFAKGRLEPVYLDYFANFLAECLEDDQPQ